MLAIITTNIVHGISYMQSFVTTLVPCWENVPTVNSGATRPLPSKGAVLMMPGYRSILHLPICACTRSP